MHFMNGKYKIACLIRREQKAHVNEFASRSLSPNKPSDACSPASNRTATSLTPWVRITQLT